MNSQAPQSWSNRVVIAASVFAGFGVAHLIDDFLYGVPAEFNLTPPTAQWLGLAFFAALAGLIALAARGTRRSYFGLIVVGVLLALADTTRHWPEIQAPGPFRAGAASVAFALGLILSGLATAGVAFGAWRSAGRETSGGNHRP